MLTINILDFTLDNPILEIILRTLAVYVFMILAIRLFGKKELAQLSVIDLVFILLISNSVQNAMVGPGSTLSGGLIAAGSLFLANFTLKRLFYRSKFFSKMVQGESLLQFIFKCFIYKHLPLVYLYFAISEKSGKLTAINDSFTTLK